MNAKLNRVSVLLLRLQPYLPVVMLLVALFIRLTPPDGGGGPGG